MPNNLLPFVAQVAVGRRPEVRIFGSDYATPDGTGVRDYIHVCDLARGPPGGGGWSGRRRAGGRRPSTSGSGRGPRVLEIVAAFARAARAADPHVFAPRRPGDVAVCYADPARPSRGSAGGRRAGSTRCARAPGPGSRATPTASTRERCRKRPFRSSYGLETWRAVVFPPTGGKTARKQCARLRAPHRGNGRGPARPPAPPCQDGVVAAPAARQGGSSGPRGTAGRHSSSRSSSALAEEQRDDRADRAREQVGARRGQPEAGRRGTAPPAARSRRRTSRRDPRSAPRRCSGSAGVKREATAPEDWPKEKPSSAEADHHVDELADLAAVEQHRRHQREDGDRHRADDRAAAAGRSGRPARPRR